jgi:hypothetical protein
MVFTAAAFFGIAASLPAEEIPSSATPTFTLQP